MHELNQLMQMLNMPTDSSQMKKMMSEISSTEDGEITMDDFLAVMKAEEKNPHTKHLLLSDFELFRPLNCPAGYIPREQLVKVLLRHSKVEDQANTQTKEEYTLSPPTSTTDSPGKNREQKSSSSTSDNYNSDSRSSNSNSSGGGGGRTSNANVNHEVSNNNNQLHVNHSISDGEEKDLKQQQESNNENHEVKWTETDIRDLIHNIPLDCFHAKNENLIHYKKLIQLMFGDITEDNDPFLDNNDNN
jgi:hypothetical protein